LDRPIDRIDGMDRRPQPTDAALRIGSQALFFLSSKRLNPKYNFIDHKLMWEHNIHELD
jgi:hypothetical protein